MPVDHTLHGYFMNLQEEISKLWIPLQFTRNKCRVTAKNYNLVWLFLTSLINYKALARIERTSDLAVFIHGLENLQKGIALSLEYAKREQKRRGFLVLVNPMLKVWNTRDIFLFVKINLLVMKIHSQNLDTINGKCV